MTEAAAVASSKAPTVGRDPDEEELRPGFVDAIKFLYARRIALAVRFIAFLGVGVLLFLNAYLSAPRLVEGTLRLTFRGIERNEYPTGRKFSVEDLRSPAVLTSALAEAGISQFNGNLTTLSSRIYVTPIIPGDIQGRWRRQEREGARRDEYFPSEFKIAAEIPGLTDAQRIRFFDALVRHYREQVKYQEQLKYAQKSMPVSLNDIAYEKLIATYDFWDLPTRFVSVYWTLGAELNGFVLETSQSNYPKYHVAFRTIVNDLETWYATRLQALEAVTYHGRLVKNRDLIQQRVQHRISEVDIRIHQKMREAEEQGRLLALIDRPKSLMAGQLSNERGTSILDASALEKLLKSDYEGPVVSRISKLQEDRQALEAEKARLQNQLAWLPKATDIGANQLPANYKDILQTVSSELREIIQNYSKLLDDYLTATVSSQVALAQPPVIRREGYASTTILAGILVVSLFLAIALMSFEHLFRKARDEARAARELAEREPRQAL
jgi:hypothetical protein